MVMAGKSKLTQKPVTKKPAKDGKGLIKNPKTKVAERPADYKGIGAPSLYRESHCVTVIDLGKQGFSKAQIASHFDVSMTTIDEWCCKHTDFSEAYAKARVHSQTWWENFAMTNMLLPQGGGSFNAAVWSKSMSARFPHDYTEKQKTELTGANGLPIQQDMNIKVSFGK